MLRTNRQRRAFTLVEMIAATAIMATLTVASFTLVRTANNAWLRHRDDSGKRREAMATMNHIVRRVRQASAVAAITTAADTAGSLTLEMPAGGSAIWSRNAGSNQVLYGTTTPTNLLATGIMELTFLGLKANGSTQTTQADLIHAVKCTIKYTVARPSGAVTETLSSQAWLRAW
jgi:prepilin-type N-terminal cleavage/methylation domain-containing protein